MSAIRSGSGAEFSINGSTALTDRISLAILNEDWQALKEKAGVEAPKPAKPRYRKDMNEHADALARMRANRDVTVLMPPHTRLAFVKKVFKKLNMATTRFQEDFNSASLDAAAVFAEYAIDAEKKISAQQKQITEQGEIIERLMIEQEKLRKIIEEIKRS